MIMAKKKDQQTLTDDQIRVSSRVRSANDVLRSAKPYLDAAIKAMRRSTGGSVPPIEVPPQVIRDLALMLISEVKRADQLVAGPRKDKGDGDWNPFNKIDFEFD
jgi:hypothetical protein